MLRIILVALVFGLIIYLCCKRTTAPAEEKDFKTFGEYYDEDDDVYEITYTTDRVYLSDTGKVNYLEFQYLDDNDDPIAMPLATKCKILECKADGTIVRESWGRPGDCEQYRELRSLAK